MPCPEKSEQSRALAELNACPQGISGNAPDAAATVEAETGGDRYHRGGRGASPAGPGGAKSRGNHQRPPEDKRPDHEERRAVVRARLEQELGPELTRTLLAGLTAASTT